MALLVEAVATSEQALGNSDDSERLHCGRLGLPNIAIHLSATAMY